MPSTTNFDNISIEDPQIAVTVTPAHDSRPRSPNDNDREPLLRNDGSDTEYCRAPPFVLSTVVKYCLLLCFLIELSNNVLTVPFISLFERAICETYYQTHDSNISGPRRPIKEEECKIAPIQGELAKLRGWKAFFETISGMS